MSKDMWMFLAFWNGAGAFYWYYRYTKVVRLIADPEFLIRALEVMEEWEDYD